jgi:hypothetical protein
MPTEAWTVDGTALNAFAYDIQSFNGMDDVPSMVGNNMTFANRHGTDWTQKYFSEAAKMLVMVVRNSDPTTGVVPATFDLQRQNYDLNLDKLTRIFYRPRRLLDVRRTLSDGTIRKASAEVVQGITPEQLGLNSGRVGFELRIPSGFWEDVNNVVTATYPVGTSTIVEFAAATAPMQDLKFRITGPGTNLKLMDVESGAYFQYNGAIPALGWIDVDSSNMSVASSGFGGFVAANLQHVGDPRWITVYPSINGVQLSLSATAGTTGATNFFITGKRKFLR